MAASKNNFLDHLRLFRSACRAVGAEVIISMESWQAFARQGDRHTTFYPQFQASVEGRLLYQPGLTDQSTMFAGWMPYRFKRWETALNKLAFKRYAQSVGLLVPKYWLDGEGTPSDVVVKSPSSSFGLGVHGPFRRSADRQLDLTQAEYYEEFVGGRLLKIWYWNGRPVCAEVDRLPFVYGDGVSTLAELIVQRASQYGPLGDKKREEILERCKPLLRYYKRGLDSVIPKGGKQVVEFRYGSFLMLTAERAVLDFANDDAPEWLDQARDAGAKLFAAIPAEVRRDTVFTVDAILPADGQVRFLEVNCNPTVHPLVYPVMVNDLMGAQTALRAAVTP